MNPITPLSLTALPGGGIGAAVLSHGTPLGVACAGLAGAATPPRVWGLR
ncbi:hypothetical protein [Methylobacterium longum]|uniref:Uncharacterized protein n=1 Tax=Methylobacterium longum TaxID=767694 RepID=A0ABT8AUS7_9HYPH|nr:hypothetical protein [Methylobacterium longum]MDN3573028.1 hypothetical protein [Methylobacterium longum]GJE15200.1 hypothetical protein FOHLNKBM_6278 [Methylobacterium longum]